MYEQQELINTITPVLKQYPIKKAALFGSYSRGEQEQNSDFDIILELDLTNDLPDIIYVIWDELEYVTQLRADVLTFNAITTLPKAVKERVLNDLRYIYEV